MKQKILVVVLLAFCSSQAYALVSPVGVSVVPPLQLPFRGSSIVGARLNLFLGVHESVMGLDLGVIGNMTDRSFGGLQVAGVFNRNKGPSTFYFAQIAGLSNVNLNNSEVYGLQLAGGANISRGKSGVVGLAIAPLGNFAAQGTIYGVEIGLVNRAKQVFGFQIGLVNIVEVLHGLQLGLVNVSKNGLLPVLPIVNFGF
jgi:hypothetical protein